MIIQTFLAIEPAEVRLLKELITPVIIMKINKKIATAMSKMDRSSLFFKATPSNPEFPAKNKNKVMINAA